MVEPSLSVLRPRASAPILAPFLYLTSSTVSVFSPASGATVRATSTVSGSCTFESFSLLAGGFVLVVGEPARVVISLSFVLVALTGFPVVPAT